MEQEMLHLEGKFRVKVMQKDPPVHGQYEEWNPWTDSCLSGICKQDNFCGGSPEAVFVNQMRSAWKDSFYEKIVIYLQI